jgi:hypothetical protein
MLKYINLKNLTAKTLITILIAGTLVTQAGTKKAVAASCNNNGHGNNLPKSYSIGSGTLTIGKYDPSNPSGVQKTNLINDLKLGKKSVSNASYSIQYTGSSYSLTSQQATDLVNSHPDWEKGDTTDDCDGDNIKNNVEAGSDKNIVLDTDGDGLPNHYDTDSDGDGINDGVEGDTTDTDNDGTKNYLDTDSDNDAIADSVEGVGDKDNDGTANYLDTDSDGDGILDSVEGTGNADNDSDANYLDTDSDGDGIGDSVEGTGNADGDSLLNYLDTDSDGDGILDSVEGMGNPDGDSYSNYLDTDSDNDGTLDSAEGVSDIDGDGIANYLDNDDDTNFANSGSIVVSIEAPTVQTSQLPSSNYYVVDFNDKSGTSGFSKTNNDTTYTYGGNLNVKSKDQWGGANETKYITQADGKTSFNVQISEDQQYFGFWWSAGDPFNKIIFKNDGQQVAVFRTENLVSFINNNSAVTNKSAYYGNPNPSYTNYNGGHKNEPFSYVNIFFNDQVFDEIVVQSTTTGGAKFESDNHTFSAIEQTVRGLIVEGTVPDSDDDGLKDNEDSEPNNPDRDGDGLQDGSDPYPNDADHDDDGLQDGSDPYPNDADHDDDGLIDGQDPDVNKTDTDEDGLTDGNDPYPNNADGDGDGLNDKDDPYPNNADGDGDGVNDNEDPDPEDPTIPAPDPDPVPDTDSDANGILDNNETSGDWDADGTPNYQDYDDDGDNIPDVMELYTASQIANTGTHQVTLTLNGIDVPVMLPNAPEGNILPSQALNSYPETPADYQNQDSDGDTIYDKDEVSDTDLSTLPDDSDLDGQYNYLDLDSDADNISDMEEAGDQNLTTPVRNTDGIDVPDYIDSDSDNDNISDKDEAGNTNLATSPINTDGDSSPNYIDTDSDADNISDKDEAGDSNLTTSPVNTDADSGENKGPDYIDQDSDDDGIADIYEAGDADLATAPRNSDNIGNYNDNFADFRDLDSDNNGILDNKESYEDIDTDTFNNFQDLDDDGDNIPDVIEIGGNPNSPTNSDNNVNDGRDYQDTDSDNDNYLDNAEGIDASTTRTTQVTVTYPGGSTSTYKLRDWNTSDTTDSGANLNVTITQDGDTGKVTINKTITGLEYQVPNTSD